MNPKRLQQMETTHYRGTRAGEYWEVDFTEMGKPGFQRYKYLLAMIDTFTSWVKDFPSKSESALIVVKKLLYKVVP